MATVYPINGYDGGSPNNADPDTPQPLNAGAYPVQLSTGYAQGYYMPPTAAYPGALHQSPPGAMAPAGQPFYPMNNPGMPAQGAYPVPQAYGMPPPEAYASSSPQPMATPYPAYTNQQGGLPYGAPPPGNGAYQGYSPPYGAPPASNPAYPIPAPLGSQPVVMYPMAVVQQGTGSTDPAREFKMREWSSGLFGCCDSCIPNFFMSWCCPCVSLAQIYARLGLTSYKVALARFLILFYSVVVIRFVPIGGGSSSSSKRRSTSSSTSTSTSTAEPLSGPALYAFLALQQALIIAAIAFARRRTRHRFKIPGNRCMDGLISCLCPCCTIAQIATHIRSYQPGACSFGGPDVLPPFM